MEEVRRDLFFLLVQLDRSGAELCSPAIRQGDIRKRMLERLYFKEVVEVIGRRVW
jgi:hypothetical protein